MLEELDSVAALIPGAYCATVFVAVLDTGSGTLQYSSAGHLPALLASPDSAPILLDGAGSLPLAVQRTKPRPQATQELPPGSTLMLFTDGLVERKERSIDTGIKSATEVLTNTLGSPAETIADAVLRELAPPQGYDDDVAIVIHRRPPSPLEVEVPATADRLSSIRGRLSAWLHAAGTPESLAADIVLAGNEACTNSAEHAYRGGASGAMRIEARVSGGEIEVRVVDHGSWKPPGDTPFRGCGIPLMRAVSDRVDLEHSATGTTVEMAFRVPATQSADHRAAENARSDST
jgi:anti-sigma regulatory factor (Ser/Thr protein kinase)